MKEVKNNNQLYSIGVLWNMAGDYSEEIINKITKMTEIVKICKYDLKEKYDSFVLDCYNGDDEAFQDNYIYDKIKNMKSVDNNRIVLFVAKINNPIYKENIENKIEQCIQVRNIKQTIRDEYSTKINGYFFDNLIHMTDNEEEYEKINSFLHRYNEYKLKI